MKSKRKRSVLEFIRDKRKANCPVCRVPQAIRNEMNAVRRMRSVTMPIVVEWLKAEHGIALTLEQCRHHYAGMHEGKAGVIRMVGR